ncbi:MAG: Holliday junction resolvase-like protein [Nanoarchaeota archaeon]
MITEITALTIIGIAVYFISRTVRQNKTIQTELDKCKHDLRSAYVKFGKTFEHFAPFTKDFPGSKETFIHLGMPIDGLCFDEDTIKFIEIKTGGSKLSPKQERIKKMVEEGKVEFRELRY